MSGGVILGLDEASSRKIWGGSKPVGLSWKLNSRAGELSMLKSHGCSLGTFSLESERGGGASLVAECLDIVKVGRPCRYGVHVA